MDEPPRQDDPFIEAVAAYIDRENLFPIGASMVVGVSGGADSVALLEAMHVLSCDPRRAYRLLVAHLDHALRANSPADAAFVAEAARSRGLECVSERRDVAAVMAETGQGLEQSARMTRYEFLRDVARRHGASHVAVGHHADDHAETVLYRILRGTHLRGLGGIPAARPLLGTDILLVRPLLGCRREEVEAFCRRRGLPWRTDPTNADTRRRRNFIRHELLPRIRDRLNPRADEALIRLAEAARDAEAVLARSAEALLDAAVRPAEPGCLVLDAATLRPHSPVIRSCALRAALERLRAPLRDMGTERFAELGRLPDLPAPASVPLPGGYVARREADIIVVTSACATPPDDEAILAIPGETTLADGRRVVCRVEPFDPAAFEAHRHHPRPGVEFLDADRLRGRLICRPRRDGDAFVPLGASGRKTVSNFLTDRRLPSRARRDVRCICDELGIVYLAPLRIDDRVKVTGGTDRILRVEFPAGESSAAGARA